MSDSCSIWLENEQKTTSTGRSLAGTLYSLPLTVLLTGELGAGKTTFLKGFAEGLGVREGVTSPTYALEQRYHTLQYGEFLHIDLYRLTPSQAQELVSQTDDHPGIRCVEWPERLGDDWASHFPSSITIALHEERDGRSLTASFRDLPLPSSALQESWREELRVPLHVTAHCRAVARFCTHLADLLLRDGTIVRPDAVTDAGELHDLLRFVDFLPGAQPPGSSAQTEDDERVWEKWRAHYAGMKHEAAACAFLRERGFRELSDIVAVHGLRLPSTHRTTIEQKLLFYADKRVKQDQVVSLEERFRDFNERYADKKDSGESQQWYEEAQRLERELFPHAKP